MGAADVVLAVVAALQKAGWEAGLSVSSPSSIQVVVRLGGDQHAFFTVPEGVPSAVAAAAISAHLSAIN